MNNKKIKILKDGPYEVSGGVPLSKGEIAPNPKGVLGLKKTHNYKLKNEETYHLCRCGLSKNKPFCDGAHINAHFDGTEVASKDKYTNRANHIKGESIDLMDDNRCAFARFCHREQGDVWTLTDLSNNEENKKEAIEGANACPAGRLTVFDKKGNPIEESSEPSIVIVEDPENPKAPCSAAIFVSGKITLESADGKIYETKDRYALCRCGNSSNTPFCDATHVSIEFNDEDNN